MSVNDKVVIFCYGTLKRGDCRESVMRGCRFIGTAKTSPDYTLYDCGSFPAMVSASGDLRTGVVGELYEAPASLLDEKLDFIEGVPFLYNRATVAIESVDTDDPQDKAIAEACAYIYQRPVSLLPHLGDEWIVSRKWAS